MSRWERLYWRAIADHTAWLLPCPPLAGNTAADFAELYR